MENNELSSLWEQRLAEYESSGQTIAAWCKGQEVRENQFYYWRKKMRVNQAENDKSVKWLSLSFNQGKKAHLVEDSIAVHIGQATIEIQKGFNQQLLREIIQVLQTI